ncbi:ribonuclease P protein subunit p14 isoform X2 [Cephus cinctus]|uniref:Ribonuclease P protein subunit p14 isoform X2 n=1 Tax=Cephus cinctus TaxID=211228 RepID=A0AAJ7FER9_CEPCN|nr:ribonuclease P protein subunit p14 isoform X2 [Cephus cinctus]
MHYLDVSLELPGNPDRKISLIFLKKHVVQSVKELFGEEGIKCTIDILKYNISERRFILRCELNDYVRLRAALTLATKYEEDTCSYTVHRASPNLLSFTANSRSYVH